MLTSLFGVGQPRTDQFGGPEGTGSRVGGLSVSSVHGIEGIERLSSEIDRLNGASTRPSPLSSAAYLRCYSLRSEYYKPGSGECLFLFRDGDRLVGCAPMRRALRPVGPSAGPLALRDVRLSFLAPEDSEQPNILCAPEDERRVASALIHHLCADEPGWGMVELAGQRPGGALHSAAHALVDKAYRVRDISVEPYAEVPMAWPDLPAYFRGLAKKMRSNIGRQARRLYATGEVELLLAEGAGAASVWFDAYCDLDDRSWKSGTPASIQRHARRVRFYREIVAGRGGFDPWFVGVLLDGVLVSGLIAGSSAKGAPGRHGAWALEMAYDRTRADLGPGQLLLLLALGECIRRGHGFFNFMQNFAYYKHRWGAESTEVVNTQIIRRVSLYNTRATAGDLKRWWHSIRSKNGGQPDAAAGNESESEAPVHQEASGPPPDQKRARRLTAAALAYTGPGVRRLDRAAARAHLPFEIE